MARNIQAWVMMQIISKIGTKSNMLGCQGREAEFLEEENVRHLALTKNNSQAPCLDNF